MPAEGERPELKLRERIKLGIATEDGLHWLRSTIVAHDQASGRLIVSWPTEQLRLFPFYGGQPLTVEVPRPDDALYTLEVLVESASTEPEPPQLVLRPTASWQRVQRRANVRQPVAIRATRAIRRAAATPSTVACIEAIITDLSAGGLHVRSTAELANGDQLDLSFELPDGSAELRLRVAVLRVATEGEVWEAGCQLRSLEAQPAVREAIVQLLLAYQRATSRRISSASQTPKKAPESTSPG